MPNGMFGDTGVGAPFRRAIGREEESPSKPGLIIQKYTDGGGSVRCGYEREYVHQ